MYQTDQRSWPALSVSRPAAELLQQAPLSLRVVSVHRHACNLRTDQQQLLALVSPGLGNGPFHIIVSPLLLNRFTVGDQVVGRADALCWAGGSLLLRHGRAWEPRVRWPQVDSATAEQLRRAAAQSANGSIFADASPSPGRARARRGAAQIQEGLSTNSVNAVAGGARRLAGLGPGLTPAGDDFLLGVMAGIWMSRNSWEAERLCAQVATVAAPRTTSLSAAWLQHAARGEFSEPWHRLCRALGARGDGKALEVAAAGIAAVGASSGRDALAGLRCALEAFPPSRG